MSNVDKPRTLTREELEKSINRLSTRPKREINLPPLVPRRTLTPEAKQKSIKHLYDDSLAHRAQRLREIEENANAEIIKYNSEKKKLEAGEEEQMVQRLYNESIERKNYKLKELYEKEISSLERASKTLGKKEQENVVARLYQEGMENNRKKHIGLFEKYVLERQPPAVQRSHAEVMIASEKLWKGEGVTSA